MRRLQESAFVYCLFVDIAIVMEVSSRLSGSYASSSPCGKLLACITDGRLRLHPTQAPQRLHADFAVKTAARDVTTLAWSSDSSYIAVVSDSHVEVRDVEDPGTFVRIDNGSGGLGRFISASFVGDGDLLTLWEFGRAKIWNPSTGKGTDLGDFKTTCDGLAWQERPTGEIRTIASLARPAAEDTLTMHFSESSTSMPPVRLPTVDAQALSWSPDGRWLAVLDTPTARPSVHFYTPDAHLFRSYPATSPLDSTSGLGVKAVTWSADSRTVALSRYNGTVVLLNATTFAPLAMIEHNITIDQTSLPAHQQAPIWREAVSAANERSYSLAAQPVSPPISRPKPSTEPSELGIAETTFSADGSYLATHDERMLSTVWVWNTSTLAAHAVLMQHHDVRKVHWHPTRASLAMLDCGEGIGYLYDASASSPLTPMSVPLPGNSGFAWVRTEVEGRLAVLCTTKSSFRVLYPEGCDTAAHDTDSQTGVGADMFEEGTSEDSLLDVLSGRKPAPDRKSETSYTDIVEIEAYAADGSQTLGLDDTFREKSRARTAVEADPLDDSQIF
ncbi:hypothetical protein LTR53_002533 [Teratosphaeriaceae sp. CCFEE 6253]|nr:hypothetical protein LTR53_002533 [Teratosphaeriaceae sp. CCFEE 6253]